MNNQIFPHVVEVITTLNESEFFETNPFVDPDLLCKKFILALHVKSSNEGEFTKLTEEEFIDVVNETIQESLDETLLSLSDKGAIQWGVNSDGEFTVSKNPDFNIEEL